MFRILVISLFVANLLLFGFQRSKPAVEEETTVTSTVKKNSGIPTIHLYGEMMEDQGLFTGNRQCFSLGPFHLDEDKEEVRLLLQEVSIRISERQTEALVEKGYWVFMPPYGSLLEANRALFSLQALGLEDIKIVNDGAWKNAISLGYYMRQENAQRRKKSLESKSYQPLMRVQRQGEPRYWLDFEQNPGSSLIALDMQNRPNDFMQRSMPCSEEDVDEFAGENLQEPVQVMAQLQVPEDDNKPVPSRSENLDSGGDIESVPQEQVETLPEQAVETLTEAVIGTGAGDATETEPENAVGTGSGDAIESEPENAVGTGQEEATETEPENAVVTGQEDAIGTEPENAVVTGQEDAIDTVPENDAGTGQEDVIGTEPENTVVTGQKDAIEPEPKNTVGTGPQDAIETQPESTVEDGLEDTLEDGQESADDNGPDDTGETGTGEE